MHTYDLPAAVCYVLGVVQGCFLCSEFHHGLCDHSHEHSAYIFYASFVWWLPCFVVGMQMCLKRENVTDETSEMTLNCIFKNGKYYIKHERIFFKLISAHTKI